MLDSQFMADSGKFISGCLACLSAMVQLEIPHVNVLTKMDLVRKKRRQGRPPSHILTFHPLVPLC